jgi:hypothetical protein
LKEQGYTITYLHRRERHGFKAGALQAGLEVAGGELVAILLMQILFLVKIFF